MAFLRKEIKNGENSITIDVVYSALQKEIRRGEKASLYWASLLVRNGFARALWKRLCVIVMEDCSANLHLIHELEERRKEVFSILPKQASKMGNVDLQKVMRLSLCAVDVLRCAKKSRAINNFVTCCRNSLLSSEITMRSNHELKSDFEILLTDPSCIRQCMQMMLLLTMDEERHNVDFVFKTLKKFAMEKDLKCIDILSSAIYRDASLSLALAQSLFLALREQSILPCLRENIFVLHPQAFILPQQLDVPDYAYDKHTLIGKRMKRGVEHFMRIGALVMNEPFDDPFCDEVFQFYLKREREHKKAKSTAVMDEIIARRSKRKPATSLVVASKKPSITRFRKPGAGPSEVIYQANALTSDILDDALETFKYIQVPVIPEFEDKLLAQVPCGQKVL